MQLYTESERERGRAASEKENSSTQSTNGVYHLPSFTLSLSLSQPCVCGVGKRFWLHLVELYRNASGEWTLTMGARGEAKTKNQPNWNESRDEHLSRNKTGIQSKCTTGEGTNKKKKEGKIVREAVDDDINIKFGYMRMIPSEKSTIRFSK